MFGVSSCLKNLLNQLLIVVFISSIFLDPAYSAHITLLLAFCTFFRNAIFSLFFEPPFALKFSIFLHFFSKRTNCTYFRNATFLDNEIAPFFETPRCTFFRNDNAPRQCRMQKKKSKTLFYARLERICHL